MGKTGLVIATLPNTAAVIKGTTHYKRIAISDMGCQPSGLGQLTAQHDHGQSW